MTEVRTATPRRVMRLKHVVVVSLVGILGLLTSACADDAEDSCVHQRDLCRGEPGYQVQDCSNVKSEYDKLPDAEKDRVDKVIECVMESNDCAAVRRCAEAYTPDPALTTQ